jgi:hypothetical protein
MTATSANGIGMGVGYDYESAGDDGGKDASVGGKLGQLGQWVNPLTASVLIWFGTNGFLEALLGDPSIAGLAPILD